MDIPLRNLGVDLKVELGGKRGEYGMQYQFEHALELRDPEIRKTWGVAAQELSWLVRHASLDGTAHVASDGTITIDYGIHDTLDLRPAEGRSETYNKVTTIAGTVWHDILGAEAAQITGHFSKSEP